MGEAIIVTSITAGILAHVDAGKTTLSEALLYRTGTVRQLGRVDKGDAFLDPDALEKRRGITIFAHQAQLHYHNLALTLLDTPGHVDFAAQTERVLSVLDYAILVVAAPDGVQGYTRTLWRLLQRYEVPTFIFVNKMDAPGTDRAAIMAALQRDLGAGCVDFTEANGQLHDDAVEQVAVQDDTVLADYLEQGTLSDTTVQTLVQQRRVFPCYFGAALKLRGVDALLAGIARWARPTAWAADFGARVFKVSHDAHGERLTWLRVTGGTLRAKDALVDGEKANQLRVYNGAKYTVVPAVRAGDVCAVTGLVHTTPGQGLGTAKAAVTPLMQPVLTYTLAPGTADIHTCLQAMEELADEDPLLHVQWLRELNEIHVQVMGTIQLEVLQQLLADRFGLQVDFVQGSILYQETITAPVEGVGHFEPLRHYAEVHLLLTPLPRGAGLHFTSDCSVDVLPRNWQHQVLTSLAAKEHRGVLTGAPITDMEIKLVNGRASNVHSVGGDFREATWRAVRQGLMMARTQGQCQLLEPWYAFQLTVGADQVGRALNDIQQMDGDFAAPAAAAQMVTITGHAPVATMRDYSQRIRAYTHRQGQLDCVVAGYQPCHNEEVVVAAADYAPVSDLENTPDSVFCAHGAGYPVPWDQVPRMAHVAYLS
ncbi:elongation factor g [Lacticaseibacillus thailandensis DSM 22698 = JCM 13996]|uniref:Elongation factor g n=1 Tax=Lacticaseibacillus thailandensis DSM 22698 = JCM 13996 TaxID=1423810 RepID=A0A0R2C6F0_9LACO|nr:elongation factor g [Lacticaseibacillus thailandensis DSM 22698 = JCM 13996]